MSRKTTSFANNQDRSYRKCEGCHGGEGPFLFKDVVEKIQEKLLVKYLHDDVIAPGSSFGDHAHKGENPFEEWYFCLSGEGVMTLDGKAYPMKPGDISVCRNGGSHGIKNTGKEDMRILVIGVSAPTA